MKLNLYCCIAALFVAMFSFDSFAKDVVRGDLAEWEVIWHGYGLQTTAKTSQTSTPVVALSKAISAANATNWPMFASAFLSGETNNSSTKLKQLYEEWHAVSGKFIYLIGAEATMAKDGTNWSAISFVPAAPKKAKDDMPTNGASAIFALKQNSEWKLVTEVIDAKVHQSLVQRAQPFVYTANTGVFHSKDDVKQWERNRNEEELKELREKEVPREQILARQIAHQIIGDEVSLKTWSDWTNYFKPTILSPPIVFDTSEPFEPSFRDPVNALRSHLRALLVGDAQTLLKYADDSGAKWLTTMLGVEPGVKKSSYKSFTNVTHITVLMTARHKVAGQEYVLVLAREQDRFKPKEKLATLQTRIFKKQGTDYVFSQDLERSYFFMVLGFAGADQVLARYPKFHDATSKSQLPPHFYTIE